MKQTKVIMTDYDEIDALINKRFDLETPFELLSALEVGSSQWHAYMSFEQYPPTAKGYKQSIECIAANQRENWPPDFDDMMYILAFEKKIPVGEYMIEVYW
jgi:hypothetical protein